MRRFDIFYMLTFTGDLHYLLDYERERLKHNVPIMVGIHGLQKLYSTDISPVVLLRSVGLQLTQAMTPLKVPELNLRFLCRY